MIRMMLKSRFEELQFFPRRRRRSFTARRRVDVERRRRRFLSLTTEWHWGEYCIWYSAAGRFDGYTLKIWRFHCKNWLKLWTTRKPTRNRWFDPLEILRLEAYGLQLALAWNLKPWGNSGVRRQMKMWRNFFSFRTGIEIAKRHKTRGGVGFLLLKKKTCIHDDGEKKWNRRHANVRNRMGAYLSHFKPSTQVHS